MTTRIELSILAVLLSCYSLWLLAMFGAAMVRTRRRAAQRTSMAAAQSEIHTALIHYLAGNNDLSPFRRAVETSRGPIECELLGLQHTAGGSALERLCDLALQLGLVRDWCEETRSRDQRKRRIAFASIAFVNVYEPCRRRIADIPATALDDRDAQVRLSAGIALARSGEPDDCRRAFEWMLTHGLLARMAAAPFLRQHAAALGETVVADALRSQDPARVRAALEILIAWERAIPSPPLWESVRTLCLAADPATAELARDATIRVRGGVA